MRVWPLDIRGAPHSVASEAWGRELTASSTTHCHVPARMAWVVLGASAVRLRWHHMPFAGFWLFHCDFQLSHRDIKDTRKRPGLDRDVAKPRTPLTPTQCAFPNSKLQNGAHRRATARHQMARRDCRTRLVSRDHARGAGHSHRRAPSARAPPTAALRAPLTRHARRILCRHAAGGGRRARAARAARGAPGRARRAPAAGGARGRGARGPAAPAAPAGGAAAAGADRAGAYTGDALLPGERPGDAKRTARPRRGCNRHSRSAGAVRAAACLAAHCMVRSRNGGSSPASDP